MLDSVFAGPAYRWAERPGFLDTIARWWRAFVDWLDGLASSDPLMFKLFVGALILVLAAILAHAAWVVIRTVRAAAGADQAARPPAPVERRAARWYFEEADRLAEAGRYAEAMRAAFGGVVIRLDEIGSLRYDPSRTPAECARAARLPPDDRERLRELVRRLYPVVFGGAACEADDYRRWRDAARAEWHALSG